MQYFSQIKYIPLISYATLWTENSNNIINSVLLFIVDNSFITFWWVQRK